MAGDTLGRAVTISLDATVIAQARTKNLTVNNEVINVTTDGDSGIQQLLATPGEKSVEVSVDGLYLSSDTALIDLALDGSDISGSLVFTYAAYTISGTFMMSNYTEGLPYNEATTFSATFMSDGAVVKAAV